MAAEDQPTVARRWNRLMSTWNASDLSARDSELVAARLRTMLELHADELPHDQRTTALASFTTFGNELSCEPARTTSDCRTDCAANAQQRISERLHMCTPAKLRIAIA